MASPSRLRALNLVIQAYGHELRDEVAASFSLDELAERYPNLDLGR